MKIQLLALQRKERYPGEYGPEIVAVVDEHTLEESPEWWPIEIARHKADLGDEADAWAVLDVALPIAAVMSALYPHKVTLHLPVSAAGDPS